MTSISILTIARKFWIGTHRAILFFFFIGYGEKPLIQKRRDNRDYGDGDERADPVELIKLRKIVKEQFHDCNTEQCQASVTRRRDSFLDSDNEQQKSEHPPCDTVAHDARKIP